jgi:hypothetical protein
VVLDARGRLPRARLVKYLTTIPEKWWPEDRRPGHPWDLLHGIQVGGGILGASKVATSLELLEPSCEAQASIGGCGIQTKGEKRGVAPAEGYLPSLDSRIARLPFCREAAPPFPKHSMTPEETEGLLISLRPLKKPRLHLVDEVPLTRNGLDGLYI